VVDKARASNNERVRRAFVTKRTAVQATRRDPPQALKRAMFCSATPVAQVEVTLDDE
jgi:hypothetical protein